MNSSHISQHTVVIPTQVEQNVIPKRMYVSQNKAFGFDNKATQPCLKGLKWAKMHVLHILAISQSFQVGLEWYPKQM